MRIVGKNKILKIHQNQEKEKKKKKKKRKEEKAEGKKCPTNTTMCKYQPPHPDSLGRLPTSVLHRYLAIAWPDIDVDDAAILFGRHDTHARASLHFFFLSFSFFFFSRDDNSGSTINKFFVFYFKKISDKCLSLSLPLFFFSFFFPPIAARQPEKKKKKKVGASKKTRHFSRGKRKLL
ncbi:hypothetical protein DFH27DRAFT_257743 [Peziza echinospora]|nr:hypothetical protein DFH27DRAFT_257743 [Peziza echinospora]